VGGREYDSHLEYIRLLMMLFIICSAPKEEKFTIFQQLMFKEICLVFLKSTEFAQLAVLHLECFVFVALLSISRAHDVSSSI
jgi:hypothetical protein